MARDGKTLLKEQAKKNQNLKILIDSVCELTEEEIIGLDQPKWICDALVEILKDIKFSRTETYVLDNCIDSVSADFQGKIYKWTGSEQFVQFKIFQILISYNDLIFVSEKGTWLDTSFVLDPNKLLPNCTFLKDATYNEYKDTLRQRTNDKYPIVAANDKPLFIIKNGHNNDK